MVVLGEDLGWGFPAEGAMGAAGVVAMVPVAQAAVGLGQGTQLEEPVELFLVGAVGALDLAVVPGGGDADELVAHALSLEVLGEGVGDRCLGHEVVGELDPMIGLDALDGEGESLTQFLEEGDGIPATSA